MDRTGRLARRAGRGDLRVARIRSATGNPRADGRPVRGTDRSWQCPHARARIAAACGTRCAARPPDRPTTRGRDPTDAPRQTRPGPASTPAPPARWLSAEDEIKLDAVAIALESGSGPWARKDPTVAENNARFELEERDPAWATAREDAIRTVLEDRRGQLSDMRVGAPVCKANICLLRAIIESTDNDRLGAWSPASERMMFANGKPGGFDGASSSFAIVDGEAVAVTCLFRHGPAGD